MIIKRTQNASRNVVFGTFHQIYLIIFPFLMRTAMIYLIGEEYTGLHGMFNSILAVLNLMELGVGTAMVYSMYKPIAEDDTTRICAMERLYLISYIIIGAIIALVGGILTPFIKYLIGPNSIPIGMNVYVLYLISLTEVVLSYWLFANKIALFQAHQRTDIISKVRLFSEVVKSIIQIVLLYVYRNYYYFILTNVCINVLSKVFIAIKANKFYPEYKPKGSLPKAERKLIFAKFKDLFLLKVGGVVTNSFDTIVISTFLGLSMLTKYQNYYFIMVSVLGLVHIFFNSCVAGIGNSIITETLDKNYNDFKKVIFITNWGANFCVVCFACLYQPFIKAWVGEKRCFSYDIVIFLCIYFYLLVINGMFELFKDASGIWHYDRFRPIISAMVNLVLNLVFVKMFGIYAIILSTIISYLFISLPWLIHNVHKYLFKRSAKGCVITLIKNVIICTLITMFTVIICYFFPIKGKITTIIINFAICLIIPNTIMWLLYKDNQYYNDLVEIFHRFTKNKFRRFIKN